MPPSTGHGHNPLEDPANDLGGPGGQELYPISMQVHKTYATITAIGVVASLAGMLAAKRLQRGGDPNFVSVLVHDDSKGLLGDTWWVPVKLQEDGGAALA